ncbi:MAG TPA: hypothetical protein VGD01_12615 [Candidatus Elarobacter sp.]|jgi:hypothetical protein
MTEILDFQERSLASRIQAADDLRRLEERVQPGGEVLVDLGENLATTSWVDGFLVPIARRAGDEPGLAIVAASEVTRNHIARVFTSRGIHARIAKTRDAALDGDFVRIPAA